MLCNEKTDTNNATILRHSVILWSVEHKDPVTALFRHVYKLIGKNTWSNN